MRRPASFITASVLSSIHCESTYGHQLISLAYLMCSFSTNKAQMMTYQFFILVDLMVECTVVKLPSKQRTVVSKCLRPSGYLSHLMTSSRPSRSNTELLHCILILQYGPVRSTGAKQYSSFAPVLGLYIFVPRLLFFKIQFVFRCCV